MKLLTKKFFERPVLKVAPELLGKYLVRRIDGKEMRFMITDIEAYDGPQDRASHARFGLTRRNAPMFEQGGVWYVYFTYGMHWLLNIVCGRKGHPSAILIRGIEPCDITLAAARVMSGLSFNGPARLTKYLRIDKSFNNKIASLKTGLWIENNSKILPTGNLLIESEDSSESERPKGDKNQKSKLQFEIKKLQRVGVSYAGPIWSKKKWRFILVKK